MGTAEMKKSAKTWSEEGFSMAELLLCVVIMVPIMSAAVGLFSVGVKEQSSEQSSVEVNQEARIALEMMAQEIAQAGSHRDRVTTLSGAITNPNPAPSAAQTVGVGSSAGMVAGDYIDIDVGNKSETVKLTAVGANTITAPFRFTHSSGAVVRLFAFPFVNGVITPTGMTEDSTRDVTTLRLFGDVNTDQAAGVNSEILYIEYAYDSANNQITRSATPITQTTRNTAVPFVRNILPNSVRFTLHTDSLNAITSVDIAFAVQTTWSTAGNFQQIPLLTKVVIPSTSAGSILLQDLNLLGGVNKLPPTPTRIAAWTGQ
jgi:hypothetical protein